MLPLFVSIMNRTIAFDYELAFATIEIGNVVPELVLSPEFETE
jgi:hypothetical protein